MGFGGIFSECPAYQVVSIRYGPRFQSFGIRFQLKAVTVTGPISEHCIAKAASALSMQSEGWKGAAGVRSEAAPGGAWSDRQEGRKVHTAAVAMCVGAASIGWCH
eukprot:1682337-Amphidinium_carterae.1